MSKFTKLIRNNWKKSIVGTGAVVYGVNYTYNKYRLNQLLRLYCEEAALHGDVPVPPSLKPKTITVILNPAANRRKAKSNFEKYCAPLLHLAGFSLNIIQTESEGQARSLVASFDPLPDLIVIAGGDGTLSETVTGLVRAQGSVPCPIGVLPLGRTNSLASALLGLEREGAATPGQMASAAMAVVRGHTRSIDSIKIEPTEEGETAPKPVYGLSGVRWGAYRDALSRQDSYWYLGSLRGHAAILFNSFSTQPVAAHVVFTYPCTGCSRCFKNRPELCQNRDTRWYHFLMPSFKKKPADEPMINYSNVVNDHCGTVSAADLVGLDINICSPSVSKRGSGIFIATGPPMPSWWEFVKEGWQRARGEPPTAVQGLEAQQLEFTPTVKAKENEEMWFSIDNEEYEVRPMKVTLIPKMVQVFCPRPDKTTYTLLEQALLGCC